MSGNFGARRRAWMALCLAVVTVVITACSSGVVTSSPAGPPTSSATPAPTTAAPPTVAPRPADDPGPLGSTGTWKKIFSDGFGGDELDLDHWRPNWLAGDDKAITKPINRREYACYDPDNVTVADGHLRLKAEQRACTDEMGKDYRYATGAVQTEDDFTFTYGFAEARIYLPPADGTLAPAGSCGPNWGAFFLNGRHFPDDGEIDVMECLSDNDVAWHYHYGTRADRKQGLGHPEGWRADMPGTSGWHTFGVDWEPGRLTFYYDGVVVGTHTDGVTDKPHYLVLAQAISGDAVAEQTMQVDWVRVWQRDSE